MRLQIPILSFVLALSFLIAAARADWPQWRGPHRDGVSDEKGWMKQWPAAGPKELWKTNVGNGCSSVAVVGGRLYTMGFALTRGPDGKTIKGDKEGRRLGADTVWCIDASSGATIWKHSRRKIHFPALPEFRDRRSKMEG